jgi:ADP-heptose:LPS heptosyltransferase
MRSVLIVKPSSLGDIVHTLPAVHFVKLSYPNASICWLANSEWVPILQGNPDLDRVISFPRREFRGAAGLLRFVGWSRELGALKPDLVLDFQGLLRSAWLSRTSGGKRIVGLSDAREGARFFYQATASVRSNQHSVDRYLALAHLVGATVTGAVQFPLPEGCAPANLELPRRTILLHPFSRGEGKSLTSEEITNLIRLLSPYYVIVVGKSDQPLLLGSNAVSLANQTDLLQLIWLIRRAAFVISVDSGPMHIASAITSQLLSIHTWSDPTKVGPYNPGASVWKNGRIYEVRELREKWIPEAQNERPNVTQIANFVHEKLRAST